MSLRVPRFVTAAALSVAAVPLDAESYIAAYVGGARTKAADVALERFQPGLRLTFENVRFRGNSFDSPIYYGYRAGHYLTRNVGVEIEFIHLKVHADLDRVVTLREISGGVETRLQARMRRYAEQFEVSHGLNMVLVNVVVRRALVGDDPPNARVALILRAGAGPTIPRPEVIVFGSSGGSYEAGPVALQAAAGAEVKLWRGVHALTEYKYTFTSTSFGIPNGRATFDVHSQHLATGLAIHF